MRYFVYSRYIGTGREDCAGIYDSWEEAIEKVTLLYNMDKKSVAAKGQYYYFIKERS